MKNKKLVGLMASTTLLSSLFLSCTYKSVDYSTRTVSVHGTGSVSVDADNATIVMSVVTRDKNVATATNQNAEIMTNVRNAITDIGISKGNLSTENFSVYQESNYLEGKRVLEDYVVTNQVKIFVKNIDQISDIIDASIAAGANQLSELQYGVSDKEVAVKQARTIAVQQAQEAAQLIAGTSGSRLGKILRIEEQNNMSNAANVRMLKATADSVALESASTPISSGKSTVTVSVDALYELK